ncbi:hypothetical protein N7509_001341 [Penicillium cosmopolitanum]|uniref:Uncharacterized protein n=1 Tax=Penicillium cosmopolitanum TaxID=1131564 RepID=A0A9W9WC38_9EURO|nr:uncharacterized protein N7509_001341 [Penicillium cosmopolitanum]KAJ5414714.1 hypothetical protein N7509_001341 [Penicillium cosmopolitanum]
MESMLSRSGPFPAHGDRNSPWPPTSASAWTGVTLLLHRYFSSRGTRVAIVEYNLANLAAWVSNIAQQIGGYFTDAWRAPEGAE